MDGGEKVETGELDTLMVALKPFSLVLNIQAQHRHPVSDVTWGHCVFGV